MDASKPHPHVSTEVTARWGAAIVLYGIPSRRSIDREQRCASHTFCQLGVRKRRRRLRRSAQDPRRPVHRTPLPGDLLPQVSPAPPPPRHPLWAQPRCTAPTSAHPPEISPNPTAGGAAPSVRRRLTRTRHHATYSTAAALQTTPNQRGNQRNGIRAQPRRRAADGFAHAHCGKAASATQ